MTSTKSTILKGFNKHFFDFVDAIIEIFPENDDLKAAKNAFEFFRKSNPTCILKAWHFFVYMPYKDKIEAGDATFFFEKDYGSDLNHLANANEIMRIIDTLREPIKNMGENNQAHSLNYMKNLCKLSAMY
jgi:hypothetical protein